MSEVKSCGVLVVRGKPIKSFLLMIHPARYDVPKGHVDNGESELECALRELREETGIGPEDIWIDPDFRFTHQYQVRVRRFNFELREKTLVMFLGYLLNDVPILLTEHTGYEWRDWNPPHRIQEQTIDPLLESVAEHLEGSR
jgi:8-oxo-dGTP pyrophosphatase MutT (NUDIX family)